MTQPGLGEVFLTKTSDRDSGIRSLLDHFDLSDYSGKKVALKANFNSADPFPASTHLDTLETLVTVFREANAASLTLAERSGMGNTRDVLERMGVIDLSQKHGFKTVILDEMGKEEWVKIERGETHWLEGFHISKSFLNADKVVQTCCLKTHRFGGHFTMSLKNSVGLVAKRIPGGLYNFMWELHGTPHQRLKIAEINKFYDVDLVVMDATKAFVNKGPETGDVVEPNLVLASKDRVAIDAVGVAILRSYGSTGRTMDRRIFELDQINRAAQLGIGVKSASDIRLTPIGEATAEISQNIENILKSQG